MVCSYAQGLNNPGIQMGRERCRVLATQPLPCHEYDRCGDEDEGGPS